MIFAAQLLSNKLAMLKVQTERKNLQHWRDYCRWKMLKLTNLLAPIPNFKVNFDLVKLQKPITAHTYVTPETPSREYAADANAFIAAKIRVASQRVR